MFKIFISIFVMGCFASFTWASDPPVAVEPAASQWEKSTPISFSLDYTIVSDYIFRGANFSEYAGEGREKLNHQLGVGLEFDTSQVGANLGTFGVSFWGEWYADQESALTPGSQGSLQEVDYTIYWSYEIAELSTTIETGWIGYTFPQAGHDAYYTNELYVSLSFDDSTLFGTEEAVLNPYVAYYLDVDDVDGAWLELGISHDFGLADLGMDNTPVLKDITITPSLVMGIDNGQMGKSMRAANLQYGLDIGYDLSSALNIPQEYGSISLTAFVYFSDAIHDAFLNDELWGGLTLSYAW
ncbi:MAG: hypothetical protein GWP14_08390 [Actinobacteria bacterium]|nr:hypothetical protein [Actinomycetota bacterium]